jgi:hypothetical protein
MKIRLGELRRLVQEASIGASPEYMRKEAIRQRLQDDVISRVISGEISDQLSLDEFFSTIDMALRALRGVRFETYARIANKER